MRTKQYYLSRLVMFRVYDIAALLTSALYKEV